MTKQEHLLTILIEECAEVQKAACKCLRFGENDQNPATKRKNIDELTHEVNDLLAVIELLKIEKDIKKQQQKVGKIDYWLGYSKTKGKLDVDEGHKTLNCVAKGQGQINFQEIW